MTSKEKAIIFVNGFVGETQDYLKAKKCALIAVDEILEATKKQKAKLKPNHVEWYYYYSEYWQEVKEEIEKL
jgi:heterodisulfide reductase subunit B